NLAAPLNCLPSRCAASMKFWPPARPNMPMLTTPPSSTTDRGYFAAAAPGLELLTARELGSLGIGGAASPGGATFSGSQAVLYRANLQLRTASRVLVRLGAFHAAAFSELRKKASRLPWDAYLRPGQTIAIHA